MLTIAFTGFSCAIGIITACNYDKESLNTDNGYIFLSLQHENNPLQLPDSQQTLSGFDNIYSSLTENPDFTYYEIYRQPLNFSNIQKPITVYDSLTQELSSSCEQAMCIQISNNVQTDFSLKLSSGEYFSEDNFFHKNGDHIPVLMGYDYFNLYNVGDTFSAFYLYSPFTFEIVGFLEPTSKISISTGSISLNKYIVMPSFYFVDSPSSETDYVTHKIHFANKTSGKAKTSEENFDNSYCDIKSILDNSSVGDYSLTTSSIKQSFLMHGINLSLLFYLCCIVSFLFALGSIWIAGKYLKKFISINTNTFLKFVRTLLISIPLVGIPLILSVILSFILISIFGLRQLFTSQLIIAGIFIYFMLSVIFLFPQSIKTVKK